MAEDWPDFEDLQVAEAREKIRDSVKNAAVTSDLRGPGGEHGDADDFRKGVLAAAEPDEIASPSTASEVSARRRKGRKPHAERSPTEPAQADATWLADALRDEKGKAYPNIANVMMAMRKAPQIRDAFAYDQMSCAVVLRRELPRKGERPAPETDALPRPATDTDTSQLQEWLQYFLPHVSADTVHKAIDLAAHENAFHPVRDYLNGLRWDSRPRVDKWLTYYLGAEASDYHKAVGRMFLIAMVARIFDPGCKSDHMPIFAGKQGKKKSTVCGILAVRKEWFSDSLPDITTKDVSQHLRGKWLIEISELSAMRKADVETLKAFIARAEERYRPSYGRNDVHERRQSNFAGTTNEFQFLKDETGGRRFWPVMVGSIDIDALKHDIDQLYAEAVSLYRAGEKWWPEAEFEAHVIKPKQKAAYIPDEWTDKILEYIANKDKVNVSDIAYNVLFFEPSRFGTADQRRISAVLKHMDWWPSSDGVKRWYNRPVNS